MTNSKIGSKKVHSTWTSCGKDEIRSAVKGKQLIVQLDPGGTTGVCCAVLDEEVHRVTLHGDVLNKLVVRIVGVAQFYDGISGNEKGLLEYEKAYHDVVNKVLEWTGMRDGKWKKCGVGVEDFVLGASSGGRVNAGGGTGGRSGISPVRITSHLCSQLLCEGDLWRSKVDGNKRFGEIEIGFRSAGMAKGACTDERLRSAGMWIPGKQHARDACRHMWVFARTLNADIDSRAVPSSM